MQRKEILFADFNISILKAWADDWFLLTAGENAPGKFNTMTVAWGSLGVMWGKPFAQVVLRPSRYTREFIEGFESFTLSAFPPEHRSLLNFCGSRSGRDVDKVKETGLTPIPSTQVEAPGFHEAELILECRKIYHDQFKPAHFLADYIKECYPALDYHFVYFGEILAIRGVAEYSTRQLA